MNTPQADTRLPRPALILVCTRGISSIGTTLTAFGLDVWVFQKTGSYATFALLAVLATLPSLVFAPFSGLLTDRLDKKTLLMACELISGLAVAFALMLHWTDALSVPAVAAVILVLALASELRWSAVSATFAMVVPRAILGRINGIQQIFRGTNVMLGPVLGAVGLQLLGLSSLLGLDLLTYVISVLGLLSIAVPAPAATPAASDAPPGFWSELTYGFRWVFQQPGLRRLLLFFMVVNIGISVFTVTCAPYLLSFSSSNVLGFVLGLQGAGAFLAGMVLARRRGSPWNHEAAITSAAAAFGVGMIAWGISRQPVVSMAIAFAFGVLESIIMASSQTAWQTQVPGHIQGRVFAVRTMVSFGLAPLSMLVSIPLSSKVFSPLLDGHGWLSAVWGAGAAGTTGLLVSVLGALVFLAAAALIARGGLRLSEPPSERSPVGANPDLST